MMSFFNKVMTMKNGLVPNLMTENVADTVRYYQDILGFKLLMAVEPVENAKPNFPTELTDDMHLIWANMGFEQAEFMFQSRATLVEEVPVLKDALIGASQTLYIRLDQDVDAHYERLKDKVKVVVKPTTKFYGMREWYLQDCNGYVLCFGQRIEGAMDA
jgi:uncharacterized glyoxalase superfamily protein PhnB